MVLAILTSRRSQDIFDSKEDTVKSAKGLGGGTNIAHFKRDYRLLKAALEVTPDMLAQAQHIFDKIVQERGGEVPLILRVDAVKGKDGILRVMEIEQVDPFLYLYTKPGVAAEKLCEGILKAVPQLRPAAARHASAPDVEKRLSAEIS
jgi:hypothetical protein